MNEMEMADAFGVPEFFVTTLGRIESAGGGCVRAYMCAERGGLLVPQYMTVMPMRHMIDAAGIAQQKTRHLFFDTGKIALIPSH
jgi:hypothetical protein